MGTFLGQALKASRGEQEWLKFFEVTGAAFAILESSPSVPGFETRPNDEIFRKVAEIEKDLHARHMLNGFSAVLNSSLVTHGRRYYHLITLDSERKEVTVVPYPLARQDQAMTDYAAAEEKAKGTGGRVDVVLVAAGPLNLLKRAFPNYFLDTRDFVSRVDAIISTTEKSTKNQGGIGPAR
jgi:putative GTP pyrophosphokinase